MKITDLSGAYQVKLLNGAVYEAHFPGTLDENQIGEKETKAEKWHPDAVLEEGSEANQGLKNEGVITTRLTRKHAYEGKAEITRTFFYQKSNGSRVFLEIERARKLKVSLNQVELTPYERGTLSTPYIYEITRELREENELVIESDNTYEGWPAEAIKYSSAATNETQTNWSGLLGNLQLREEQQDFISSILVYPKKNKVTVKVEFDVESDREVEVEIKSAALKDTYTIKQHLKAGRNQVTAEELELREDAMRWDEYEGNLYTLTVSEKSDLNQNPTENKIEEKTVSFGIRDFEDDGKGHLALNGHRIFLRSEANCCVFAETGHMPMSREEWREALLLYKDYGINCVRFHSHCPPEAAFAAADLLGMLIQPELSNWDPKKALESELSFSYYKMELQQILKLYGNHPSFVMLTFGNELWCNEGGISHMHDLLNIAHSLDHTRLFASASNGFYGQRGADLESDFYTSSDYCGTMIRGTSAGMKGYINNKYPDAKENYNAVFGKIRETYQKPVYSFEVGQYEVLPDFKEIKEFTGVTIPNNIENVRKNVEKAGFLADWEHRVEVSGKMSAIAYREEIEAALRTPELSGISLLGLQDFPGQGTALVGMMNSHFEPKPYEFAKPEHFRQFFCSCIPLVQLEKYTYEQNETLTANVLFANYGKENVGGELSWKLVNEQNETLAESTTKKEKQNGNITAQHSMITAVGTVWISLGDLPISKSSKIMLTVSFAEYSNTYPVWVYIEEKTEVPESVVIARTAEEAWLYLEQGKNVFLSPEAKKENFKNAITTTFTTDFWSVGTFPEQEGYMGCLPKPTHKIFEKFPTEDYPDWQWWSLTTNACAFVLEKEKTPLLEVMDSYARLRKLAFFVEAKAGTGKLLISGMGLLEKQQYPEARAMLASIYAYMDSDAFVPEQTMKKSELGEIIA